MVFLTQIVLESEDVVVASVGENPQQCLGCMAHLVLDKVGSKFIKIKTCIHQDTQSL